MSAAAPPSQAGGLAPSDCRRAAPFVSVFGLGTSPSFSATSGGPSVRPARGGSPARGLSTLFAGGDTRAGL